MRLRDDPLSTAVERVALAPRYSDAAFLRFIDPENRYKRPAVTAWEGADIADAYYLDAAGQWRNCLTDILWAGRPS